MCIQGDLHMIVYVVPGLIFLGLAIGWIVASLVPGD